MGAKRWEPCVYHQANHADAFLRDYLALPDRRPLFVLGAGFDPRSTRIAQFIPEPLRRNAQIVLLREERPNPSLSLVTRANRNRDQLIAVFPVCQEHNIAVFAPDNAVVGGREAARLASRVPLDDLTDIFIDTSALSIGVAFPIIRHFIDLLRASRDRIVNLHLIACHNPAIDDAITSLPSDVVTPIHGFRGGWGLDDKSGAAILWMPQLAHGKRFMLHRIFQMLRNVQKDTVVCPVLPFPSSRPRRPDDLIEEFAEELQTSWSVDARDLVYADEKSPLDLYRTILRIDDARRRVFASVGGSQIILSPLGSKALSLGALMAAIERDFTILNLEPIGYAIDEPRADAAVESDELVHIWLHGDAYGSEPVNDTIKEGS